MNLLDLPSGSHCFVDANVLYLHLVWTPTLSDACTGFVHRVSRGEISAFVSSHVLSDVMHKVMTTEAAQVFARPRAGLVPWLAAHPEQVRQLHVYRSAIEGMLGLPLHVLPVEADVLKAAAAVIAEHGLLTNDALILAQMRRHGLADLVTNDTDFLRVPGLRVWMPR